MTNHVRLLATASVLAVAALGASPVLAAGTTSGTVVTNNVNVDFQVGGINQTASTASNTFTVDRKIMFTVAEELSATTPVSPGATASVTSFIISNTSNAPLDFSLSGSQLASGAAAPHGGNDGYDLTGVAVYEDVDDDGIYNPAIDNRAFVDGLGADGSQRVFVVGDTPLGTANGTIAAVRLTAVARETGAAGALGGAITEDTGANQEDVEDTVFADAGRDNSESALDDYTVSAANLTVLKSSTVISDPINSSNFKMIPGAVVEYCITVANASGASTATNITVTDTIPANTTFVSNSVYLEGDGSCQNGTNTADAPAAGTLTMPLSDIAGNSTLSARFRVTVD